MEELVHKHLPWEKTVALLTFVVALLTIVTAFLGASGILAIDLQQVILATLGFLAIESLLERLGILGNLTKELRSLKKSVAPESLSEMFFCTRRNFSIETLLDEARREIWISGITLATMVMQIATLKSKLEQGYDLRFLALTPDGIAIREGYKSCSAATAQMERPRAEIISNNLKTLQDSLTPFATQKGQLEIRTIDRIPAFGFLIADPGYATSQMRVQMYPHQVEIDEAPLFQLSKKNDQMWYRFFYAQFEKLWNEAKEFQATPLPSRT